MRVMVKARVRARDESVEPLDQAALPLSGVSNLPALRVSTKEPPVDDRANQAIVRLVAEHFGVARHAVRIVSGHTASQKVLEVEGVTP